MGVRAARPGCGSTPLQNHGPLHSGNQPYQRKACGRQGLVRATEHSIADGQHPLIEPLLHARKSLRGICQAVSNSLTWRWHFLALQARPG
jgi:hypothetical protein